MIKSRLFFCVFLLFLSMHQIQVSALFNVTKEALLTGLQYKNEAEKKEDFKTMDDLNTKLNKIQNIFFSFVEKNHLENVEYATDMLQKYFIYLRQYDLYDHIDLVYKYYNEFNLRFEDFINTELYPDVIKPWIEQNLSKFIDEIKYKYLRKHVKDYDSKESSKDLLNECHEVLKTNNSYPGKVIVTYLNKIHQFEQSQQEAFLLFSKSIMILDAFAYNSMQHAYALYQVFSNGIHLLSHKDLEIVKSINDWKEKDTIKAMNSLENKFKQRNEDTILFVKKLASQMPRESWNQNDKYLIYEYLNDTFIRTALYTKLKNVFQKYIVNEVDINPDKKCNKKCLDYDETKVYGCLMDKEICTQPRTCNGNLWDCDQEIKDLMNICPSIKYESSRYLFLETSDDLYGGIRRCKKDLIKPQTWFQESVECTYCICTCDNANIRGDRYFNLRDVTSDIEFNYLITNARFKIENNIIHIQIQQAQLLPEAEVNVASIRWKPIDNYTIHDKQVENGKDYHTISWDQRTICLDELTSPSSHVFTGLRFTFKDGYLQLEIRATPFDYKTGKLASNMSYWIFNDDDLDSRNELKFHKDKKDIVDLKSSQCFRFTTSDMKKDVGQNTIPYIDLEKVEKLKFALPVSGFGIYYKRIKNIGDLLSLNLVTYDITPHIE